MVVDMHHLSVREWLVLHKLAHASHHLKREVMTASHLSNWGQGLLNHGSLVKSFYLKLKQVLTLVIGTPSWIWNAN
jgi:hypothetical protein